MEAVSAAMSVQEVTLSHGQHLCRFTGEEPAISPHFISFGIHFHARSRAVQDHRTLADLARVHDGKKPLCEPELLALLQSGLADERDRALSQQAAKCGEHGPVIFW